MAQVISPSVAPKDDALSTLIKGLSIAGQIYGIRANMAQLDEYQKKQEHEQNLAQGKYNKNEQLQLGEKFDVSSNAPTEGKYVQATDLSSESPIYLSLKKDNSPILKEIKGIQGDQTGTFVKDYRTGKTVDFIADAGRAPEKVEFYDKNGNKVTQFVEPKAGMSFTSYGTDKSPVKVETVDANGNPIISFVTPKAGDTYPGQPKAPPKVLKEQYDAALFGRRIEMANSIFDDLVNKGYNRASLSESAQSFILPEVTQSSDLKRQSQAERNFVNAVLRRESGSAISNKEFSDAEIQYFPRGGDSPELLAQKAQNRAQALAGLKAAAGDAWDQVPLVALPTVKKDSSGQAYAGPQISAPKVGSEDNGYVYQGGDPGKPTSWKKK